MNEKIYVKVYVNLVSNYLVGNHHSLYYFYFWKSKYFVCFDSFRHITSINGCVSKWLTQPVRKHFRSGRTYSYSSKWLFFYICIVLIF